MSYITSFMDGEKYGADEINKIISRFVHSGIEDPFIDGEPYNVRRLNDLSKPVTTRGVIGSESNALLVIKSGTEYFVSPGTAFFGNGSTLEVIEAEPLSLSDASLTNYVYLVSSEEENRNYIEVSTTEPDIADENIVMLCEISVDGVISDRRCYATGKLRGMYQDNEFTLKSIRIQDRVTFPEGVDEVVINHDLGCSSCHMMAFVCWHKFNESGGYADFYEYDPSKGHKQYDSQNNTVIFWLPCEDLYFGISARDDRYTNNKYYIICSNNSAAVYGWSERFFWPDETVKLQISHIEGNNWEFKYSYSRQYSSPDVVNRTYDYKLFYI